MNFKDILSNLFGNGGQGISDAARSFTLNVIGKTKSETDYVNNIKGNRKLLRQMYHNVNKTYALAAQLVKPIVNNNVNFIGIPTLFGNKKALKIIEDVKIDYRTIHKSIEIDGSVFIWVQWNQKKESIELVQIPVTSVNEVFIDPESKEIMGYRLIEHVNYSTPQEDNLQVDIVYTITADVVAKSITGSMNKKTVVRNPFGVLPIVRFTNDADPDELFGHAEFESIAPQLKFYHELTYEAGSAQSRDGHPKLKVSTNNVKQWINNNFGAGAYDDVVNGKKAISMEDRDLFINTGDDDVGYLYLNKTSGDYVNLSNKTFTNVVQGSETPEINFGANMGTSLASVKEYRPVWIKKIDTKQYERTQPWLEVYQLIIDVFNFVHFRTIKMDIEMTWPRPNFASIKEQADIIKAFSSAIDQLLSDGSVTPEEVYNTLKKIDIIKLDPDYNKHKEVIDEQMAKKANGDNQAPPDPAANGDAKGNTKNGQ